MPRPIDETTYLEQFRAHPETALDKALDNRKFEIELYWKRATYFWLLNAAAFAGYITAATSTTLHSDILVAIACVGLVLSFAWYLVNKGSRQWQDNWESHVDMLEDSVTGPLYKTVLRAPKPDGVIRHLVAGAEFSVSKINIIVSLFAVVIWLILIIRAMMPLDVKIPLSYVLLLTVSALAIIAMWRWGKTSDADNIGLEAKLRTTTISGGTPPDTTS
jgi:hypothetical protein